MKNRDKYGASRLRSSRRGYKAAIHKGLDIVAPIGTSLYPIKSGIVLVAGKGKGITGKRSGLWKYYAEAIGILRPKYAVIENVPMLINRGLNVILADLAKNGYDAEWFNL